MSNSEINVITHLIEIEQNSSALVRQVQEDSNKKIAETKVCADELFKKEFSASSLQIEKDYNLTIEKLSNEYKSELDNYIASVKSVEQDTKSFNSLLEKILIKN